MIVECFGVPGSGKSTLTSKLVEREEFSTVPPYVSRWYSLLFMLRHPIFTTRWILALLSECKKTKTWTLLRFKVAVFLNTVGRIEYGHTHFSKEKIVILDEGIMQRMLSLLEERKTEKEFEAWMAYIPRPHTVIFCENMSENISKRKVGTKRKQFGDEYAKEYSLVLEFNYWGLKEEIEKQKEEHCNFKWDENKNNLEEAIKCLKRRTRNMSAKKVHS
jgi:GTPase SAR1 family protein